MAVIFSSAGSISSLWFPVPELLLTCMFAFLFSYLFSFCVCVLIGFVLFNLNRLRKGINILISTPGRLVDHIKSTECIHFRRTQWLIIDEADR